MRVGTVYNSLPNFYSKGDFFLCLLQVGSATPCAEFHCAHWNLFSG